MTKEDLTEWHHTVFWPNYCSFLETPIKTDYGPGGKGKSLAKILRMSPSKELREKIIFELLAQKRHRKSLADRLGIKAYLEYSGKLARKGETIYQNRQALTYLNGYGWEDDVPNLTEMAQKPEERICRCGKPTMGPKIPFCVECNAEEGARLRLVK